MKRKITVLAAFLLCAVMLLAFAACNPKPTLTGIEYVSGIKNYYYKDDVIAPEKSSSGLSIPTTRPPTSISPRKT